MKLLTFFVTINFLYAFEIEQIWNEYKQKYKKSYNLLDDKQHKKIFFEAVNLVANHDAQNFTLTLNKFADVLLPRQIALQSSRKHKESHHLMKISGVSSVPKIDIDWRDHGFVTSVRDQGLCGACYAIATMGALEGIYSKLFKSPVEFSIQELIDCSANEGCDGGWLDLSFEYINKKFPQQWPELEVDYSYEKDAASCRLTNREQLHKLKCISYLHLQPENENELYAALLTSPVPAAIATTLTTTLYSSGIIEGICKENRPPDHAVLVVGYKNDPYGGYWIVKNSWGADWGEGGYFRLRAGINECKIASNCVVPIVALEV